MSRTLLLVDDEEPILRSLKRLFRRLDYTLLFAKDAQEALALIAEHDVQVILTDFRMPGCNGSELLQEALCIRPDVVGLILSGQADLNLVIDSFNNGSVFKFIPKPWQDDELIAQVNEAFERWERNAQSMQAIRYPELHSAQLEIADPVADAHILSRQGVMGKLQAWSEKAKDQGQRILVAYLDVPQFRALNDSLGYRQADRLLRMIAQRLFEHRPEGSCVGHMGGDEMVVMMRAHDEKAGAEAAINNLLRCFEAPFRLNGHEIRIRFRAGYAIGPDDGEDPERLLRNAQAAVDHLKQLGQLRIQRYDSGLNGQAENRLRLQTALFGAIDRNEFYLNYQPKIDTVTGCVVSAEVLLRWQHPELGNVSPALFIPVAEANGLIDRIGSWVLERTCQQLRQWKDNGAPTVPLAVNLSASQLLQPDLPEQIKATLDRHGVAPDCVQLEVTETLLIQDMKKSRDLISRLKSQGFSIALDDFGTGYSSLGYLNQLPVDTLKVDKCFLDSLVGNPAQSKLVSHIIKMSHSLGVEVVAEGVEHAAQYELLREFGCDLLQGYLFSRPIDADAFRDVLIAQPFISGLSTDLRRLSQGG